MDYLPFVRSQLTSELWSIYQKKVRHAAVVKIGFENFLNHELILDHYAIIDLPSVKTGLKILSQVFSSIGYKVQGRDYLPEKQNEFIWMAEVDAVGKLASKSLPQVVIADFHLNEMPNHIRKIIEKYVQEIKNDYLSEIQNLSGKASLGDKSAAHKLIKILIQYVTQRDWPLPTIKDFKEVCEFNELLAWTLLFGRQPNHFTVSVHLMDGFNSLQDFNNFVENKLQLRLHETGGVIKGDCKNGLEQSSTNGELIKVALADGAVDIREGFMEFIWRFPHKKSNSDMKWDDYYTGFIANNANKVIESIYKKEESSCD